MRFLSRVVWSEGMHLAQHHFQAQSRYFEELTDFALSSLFFEPYGLLACELDAEALLNGTVSLRHARGVLPDGLVFHFPEDPLPDPIEIRELFSPTHDSHLVLLAIPAHRADGSNCAADGGAGAGSARYRPRTATLPDETTGRDEKPVEVAVKNFRLLLDTEARDGLVSMPVARVRRDGAGHFIYDPDYIAPCLRLGASAHLMQLLARLTGILDSKAESLAAERRETHAPMEDYASREVASFWLSHAIHSSLAPLRHQLETASAHPEELFTELSRLAGALCTFSLDSHPRELPAYDHERLDHCFDALDRHIREHLDIILPTNAVTIPVERTDASLRAAKVADARCLGRSRWYLCVRSGAPAADLAARIPKLVKVCSAKHVERLVKEAFAGLAIEHVPAPPAELAPRAGTQYFSIAQTGPCWKSIVDTAEVGIYVPAAIADADLDIAVVLES